MEYHSCRILLQYVMYSDRVKSSAVETILSILEFGSFFCVMYDDQTLITNDTTLTKGASQTSIMKQFSKRVVITNRTRKQS